MLYRELLVEAEHKANSPEGMARLVAKLLWRLPVDHPLLPAFRQALHDYVYAKRTLEIWAKKGVERTHWTGSRTWTSTQQMELEHQNAQEIEAKLIGELGKGAVLQLKREIGRSLQELLSKRRRTL